MKQITLTTEDTFLSNKILRRSEKHREYSLQFQEYSTYEYTKTHTCFLFPPANIV